MSISLNEDNLGFSATEIFIPNIVVCGAVAVRLARGFVGIHFTPATTAAEITVAANYAATTLAPLGGAVQEVVFFVNSHDFGAPNVSIVTGALSKAFGISPKVIAKPAPLNDASLVVDLWLHVPVPRSVSWMGVRPHPPGPATTRPVTPINNHVLKIKSLTNPPTVVVAPIQNLPSDAGTANYRDSYQSI